MKRETYNPTPIETKEIVLMPELELLVEKMSEKVHDVWAKNRVEQGWTYGEARNDVLKQHPCLVPYAELSEDEKNYDRHTSIETLKLILSLGFKISRD